MDTKNDHLFRYLLNDLKVNPDEKLQCFDNLSTFEKVLITSKSRYFIELCLCNGSDFYRVSIKFNEAQGLSIIILTLT